MTVQIVDFLDKHAGSVQGITTFILTLLTGWYAVTTRKIASAAVSQAEAARKAAQTATWIEAQRVFTTKEFASAGTKFLFGEIRRKVMSLERPIKDWGSTARIHPAAAKKARHTGSFEVTEEEALFVCRGMCEVADLVEFGGLDLRLVLRAWGDPFRKSWIVLAPLVRSQREERKWPLLWARFETVGETALHWLGWPADWSVPEDWKADALPGPGHESVFHQMGWRWAALDPAVINADLANPPCTPFELPKTGPSDVDSK